MHGCQFRIAMSPPRPRAPHVSSTPPPSKKLVATSLVTSLAAPPPPKLLSVLLPALLPVLLVRQACLPPSPHLAPPPYFVPTLPFHTLPSWLFLYFVVSPALPASNPTPSPLYLRSGPRKLETQLTSKLFSSQAGEVLAQQQRCKL